MLNSGAGEEIRTPDVYLGKNGSRRFSALLGVTSQRKTKKHQKALPGRSSRYAEVVLQVVLREVEHHDAAR